MNGLWRLQCQVSVLTLSAAFPCCFFHISSIYCDIWPTVHILSHFLWFLEVFNFIDFFYLFLILHFFPALLVPSSLPTQCGFYFLTFEIIKKLKRYLTIGRISWKATLHKLESVHVCFCVCLHFRQYSRWIQFCETFLGQELSSWSVREDWDRAQYHVINGSISKL